MYDYLIVGAGFSGCVLAERITSQLNEKVLIVDKRDHIGGNCHDYYDSQGVLVHKYGPHYFRTNSQEVIDYLSKFTEWRPYEYKVKTYVSGELYPIPINRNTINKFFNINLEDEEAVKEFLEAKREKIEVPSNSEEHVLSKVGSEMYEQFFKHYTIKQWGVSPKELDASVCARIPVRLNTDDRYVTEDFQAMPLDGYHKLFNNMVTNSNITIQLNSDFKKIDDKIRFKKLIFTGPIDIFFNHKFGKLPYRSLRFEHEQHDKEFYQEWLQVNYPNDFDFTRIVEIKHATGQKINKTTIVKEYPQSEGEPFYPMLLPKNRAIYDLYKAEADKLDDVIFLGRLAEYKYKNMDQIVAEALRIFEEIKLGK
jgi:UDP-galactopyranose mutase